MQKRSLKNYTYRYLVLAILVIIGIWAAAFYLVMIEEVYDNIDDGLKESKERIIKEAASDPGILNTKAFGIAQFRTTELPGNYYETQTRIYNSELYMREDDDKETVRILETIFKSREKYYQLVIYTSTVKEEDLLQYLLIALVILYLSLVVSILVINHFILGKAWRPFYGILEKLKQYKPGGAQKFERSDLKIKEFSNLEEELYTMIERNESVYTRQKQFIENASHELQTPLAIAANKLELLMEERSLTEQQLLKIDDVNSTLNRLKRINRSLLTLSKIDNRQFPATEQVNFNITLKQLLEEYNSLIQFKGVQLKVHENGKFDFDMNRELATVLVSNLLKNAIVHSSEDQLIEITISPRSFVIKNEGETPLDTKFIFERFNKGEQNRHSTGLGLAIVRSISNLYNDLAVRYYFKKGHCFEISAS